MQLTRLGHATLLVETPYTRVLIDPGVYSDGWHGLADLDAIFVTHQHADHFDASHLADLIGSNPTARLVVEPGVESLLADTGLLCEPAGTGVDIGPTRVEVVGGRHALVHRRIRRIGNIGYVVSEGGGARLFHPGDAYDTIPDGVDVLALPLTAPWARASATADFLNAVAPTEAFPIHDAGASATGRATYLRIVQDLIPPEITLHPLEPTASLSV